MAYYPTARYSVNNGRIKVTLSDASYARMVAVAHMVAAYLTIQGISDGAVLREDHGRIILEAADLSTAGDAFARTALESALASAEYTVCSALDRMGLANCACIRLAG